MENNTEIIDFNLIEKYKNSDIREQFNKFIKDEYGEKADVNEKLNLKTGDVVSFIGGMNDDMRYTTEVLGFDREGHAFVLWDCYWAPVDIESPRRKFHPVQSN